jgi:hypothetical protein
MTLGRFAGAGVLALAAVAGSACAQEKTPEPPPPNASTPPATDHVPAAQPAAGADAQSKRYDGPLPPLPAPPFVPPRPPAVVKATYEFAARRPDVLRYIPCFCGCERSGHAGNDDCFVSSREASGAPVWDLHGMG